MSEAQAKAREFCEEEQDREEALSHECKVSLSTLPSNKGWVTSSLYKYEGFWFHPARFSGILAFQKHFKARDTDIILATLPKSGTTWLKALAFVVLNRARYSDLQHPLKEHNSHGLVPFLEFDLYAKNQVPDLTLLPSPRLFATHFPYNSLPESARESACRIVYLCRNPTDNFVSLWTFCNKLRPKTLSPLTLEEAFELFCSGASPYGPYWDHTLDYWKERVENPQKVLFLRYEDLKKDPVPELKRLAKFMGVPFSLEEERRGMVEDVIKICSFENLSSLEVNTSGRLNGVENNALYRKGKVGDSENYLTHQMVEKLDGIVKKKFEASGVTFNLS